MKIGVSRVSTDFQAGERDALRSWSRLQPLEQPASLLLVAGRWGGCRNPSAVELVELFAQLFVLQWVGGGQDPVLFVDALPASPRRRWVIGGKTGEKQ